MVAAYEHAPSGASSVARTMMMMMMAVVGPSLCLHVVDHFRGAWRGDDVGELAVNEVTRDNM